MYLEPIARLAIITIAFWFFGLCLAKALGISNGYRKVSKALFVTPVVTPLMSTAKKNKRFFAGLLVGAGIVLWLLHYLNMQ